MTATSGGVTLTSGPPAVLTVAQPPVITTPPLGQTVAIGANVVLSVAASGDGPFNYQWRLNGAGIPGATNSTYSILAAQPLNSGSYQVVVGNAVAFAQSAPAVVQVQSGNGAVPAANNDYFSNRISINPLLGPVLGNNQNATSEPGEPKHDGKPGGKSIWYTWQASFTGVISLTTQGSDFDTLLAVYTGTNVSQLTPVAADDDSGGFFTSLVTVQCDGGNQLSDRGGRVQGGVGKCGAGNAVRHGLPGVDSGFRQQRAGDHQAADQPVGAGGGQSDLERGRARRADLSMVFPGRAGGRWRDATAAWSSPIFRPVRSACTTCWWPTRSGSVKSEQASVQIAATNQPGAGGSAQDKFGDAVDLAAGDQHDLGSRVSRRREAATRAATASRRSSARWGRPRSRASRTTAGRPAALRKWFVYTAPITNGGTLDINTAGSTFNTILAVYTGPGTNFASLVPQGCGFTTNYQKQGQPNVVLPGVVPGTRFYIAVDGYQGASGTVQLHIGLGAAPSLVSPPVNQFVVAGSNATFNVTAIGSTNFGYQWQFNGVSIPKATNSSYTVTNASPANAGSYTVIVSNVVATVTSAPPATLTIQSAPAITAQPTNQTVYLGQKAGLCGDGGWSQQQGQPARLSMVLRQLH